jgi:histidine decarboxylase
VDSIARDADVEDELSTLFTRLARGRIRKAGFPGADDLDYSPLWRFFDFELNNIGDPEDEPTFVHHTKQYERVAVDFFADLLGAPEGDRWGYVTTGSTECLQYGLLRARQYYPDAITYYSAASHYKVARVLRDLRMPGVCVPASPNGEMSYVDLGEVLADHPGTPVIVVATAGTTMTEAVDSLTDITAVLERHDVLDRYIHVDAALSGVPLGLLPAASRPAFDFRSGADSIGFSLHKFLATRMPGGIVIARNSPPAGTRARVPYTGAADTTIGCSRNGHLALMAWYAVRTLGVDGLRRRAEEAWDTADYLVDRLTAMSWPAWRNPHAMTVVLATPPKQIRHDWQLATEPDGWSHYVCLPGRGRDQVDGFVADLEAVLDGVMVQPPALNQPSPLTQPSTVLSHAPNTRAA